MIVERLVWRAKFGRGDTIAAAFKHVESRMTQQFGITGRVLVDVTGPMFTVVVESEYRDMAHVAEREAALPKLYADPEFQEWFSSWQGAVESGARELYRVVE